MSFINIHYPVLRFIFAVTFLLSIQSITGCAATGSGNSEGEIVSDSTNSIPEYTPKFDRERPVIAVVGENSLTELTDYVVPYGILAEADIADVYALSTQEGPIHMFPALKIQAQNTIEEFDLQHPQGADYVIVPAVHETENPVLLEWVQAQAEQGAIIVGICDGVWVVANAGLLENRKAVGHWYSFKKLGKKFPETEWIRNQRYLADENVITTTGVSASIPVSLALIEAISGPERASEIAESMGESDWSPVHNSSDFKLKGKNIFTAAKNWLAFWTKEDVGVPVFDDVDEIALALLADSYSRTFRSKALSVSQSEEAIVSRRNLVILPDVAEEQHSEVDRMLEPLDPAIPATQVLDETLLEIEHYYGRRTADFVALQLEYPYSGNQ